MIINLYLTFYVLQDLLYVVDYLFFFDVFQIHSFQLNIFLFFLFLILSHLEKKTNKKVNEIEKNKYIDTSKDDSKGTLKRGLKKRTSKRERSPKKKIYLVMDLFLNANYDNQKNHLTYLHILHP